MATVREWVIRIQQAETPDEEEKICDGCTEDYGYLEAARILNPWTTWIKIFPNYRCETEWNV